MTALDALNRARAAWERSEPQLFLELFPDDGLDDTHEPQWPDAAAGPKPVGVVEPIAVLPRADGLNPGDAEPCRAHAHGELTVPRSAPSLPPGGGSASSLSTTAPGRSTPQVKRGRGQEVTS